MTVLRSKSGGRLGRPTMKLLALLSLAMNPDAVVGQLHANTPFTTPDAHRALTSCHPAAVAKIRVSATTGQPIQMFEFMAYDSSSTDVAPGKAVTQSTTQNNKFGAGKAVDRNNSTFSHTASYDTSATWEVELGQYYTITSVSVLNRWCVDINDGPGCLCRLSGATVDLLDASNGDVASASFGDTCGKLNPILDFNTCSSSCSAAKKVRLEATTGKNIHVFELRALSGENNKATSGTATQSSTFKNKFPASYAIDANTATFSHTDDVNSWLQVELATAVVIDTVQIVNRWCSDVNDIQGCLCRLSQATLSILDINDDVIDTVTLGNTCGQLLISHDLSCAGCGTTPEHCSKNLSTPECSGTCYVPQNAMFDVEAIKDIEITKLSFQITEGYSEIKVYSALRTYVGIETNASAWTLIAAESVSTSKWETITVHIQDIPLSAGSKRAFYISASGSGKLLIEDIEGDPNTLAADDNIKLLNPTKISPSAFGNLYSGDYAWIGSISYTIYGESTPTTNPPTNPTLATSAPTRKPTPKPTPKPTLATSAPTRKPTPKPTPAPVSKAPITAPPTNPPTLKPITLAPVSQKPISSSVSGFTKMNKQGYCLDASNELYSAFESDPLPLNTSDAHCLSWCAQNLHPLLVAVETDRNASEDSLTCYCDFSGGAVPNSIDLSDYNPPALGAVTDSGFGFNDVKSTDSTFGVSCYRYINFEATSFTKNIEQGYCLDASNEWYSRFESDPLPLNTTSDTHCLSWCTQNLHPLLVAVETYRDEDEDSLTCYCDFSGGALPNSIELSDYNPPALQAVTYPGVGRVKSTNSTFEFDNKSHTDVSLYASAVMLQSSTQQQIHVFELKAFSAGSNAAYSGTASQSSTLKHYNAALAIDGNLASFSHTNDASAWWRVDLSSPVEVDSVTIHNRWCGSPADTSRCLCRLSDATLSLWDASGSTLRSVGLGNTCEKAILETTISGSNTCLTNPKDVYRTCFQRAIDPSNSLTEDAILRNIGPHTAPYIAEDEELNHETVYLSLVRSNTAQLTCDDELELEEIALEWLKDNLGSPESFSVVCAFYDGYESHEEVVVRDGTNFVIETAAMKMDLVFVTNKTFTWSDSFNETMSTLTTKAGTVCSGGDLRTCCTANKMTANSDAAQKGKKNQCKSPCNKNMCKKSRRFLTKGLTNKHVNSAHMHSLSSSTNRALNNYDFAGMEFNDVLWQYTKLEPITTGALVDATNLEDVAVCGANSYSFNTDGIFIFNCTFFNSKSCLDNCYYDQNDYGSSGWCNDGFGGRH